MTEFSNLFCSHFSVVQTPLPFPLFLPSAAWQSVPQRVHSRGSRSHSDKQARGTANVTTAATYSMKHGSVPTFKDQSPTFMIIPDRERHKAGDAGGHSDRCWAPGYIAKNQPSLLGRFTMPISIVLGSRRTGRSRWIDTNRLYASRLSLIAFTLPASVEGGCKRIPGFMCSDSRDAATAVKISLPIRYSLLWRC